MLLLPFLLFISTAEPTPWSSKLYLVCQSLPIQLVDSPSSDRYLGATNFFFPFFGFWRPGRHVLVVIYTQQLHALFSPYFFFFILFENKMTIYVEKTQRERESAVSNDGTLLFVSFLDIYWRPFFHPSSYLSQAAQQCF